ncbi:MAG: hypothetical protein IKQ72_10130 [Bacteroidaceae bacterium]|nr:hypothetical protein [Bacteroidaceae bacterium]
MSNKQNLNQKKPSFVSAPPKEPKKETQPFCISAKVQKIMPWCYAAIFAVIAACFLIVKNSDTLYMAQSHNLFMNTSEYFADCMSKPGGLLVWMGTYFTQYFYYPTTGASILIALWLLIIAASKYAFNMKSGWTILAIIPIAALLCSSVCLGYWIYYIKSAGYFFTSSLGLLFTLIAVFVCRMLCEKLKLVWVILWAIVAYPLFGWFSWLGTIYMIVAYLVNYKDKQMNKFIIPIAGVAVAILVPIVALYFYPNTNASLAYIAVLPLFWSNEDFTTIAELPFVIMALAPLAFTLVSKKENAGTDIKGKEAYALLASIVIVFCASYYAADKANIDDYNYHAEMRMYRGIEEQRWNDVLTEMGNIPGDATREMVLFKNIALLNTGKLGSALFRYNNMSAEIYKYDSLEVHMVQTAAPLIYYNHAKTNFAYRWCIENSVEFGYNISNLQNLTRCSIIAGEWDVAKKYLDILKTTTFHKEWAEHYDSLVNNPKLMSDYHEFDVVKELYDHMGSTLDGDNGLCEMYLLNYFSNTMNKDSKLLQELTLAYACIQKDIQMFWPRFFLYANLHKGEDMPIHYQEAAFLYGNLEPGSMDISHMPFDKEKVIDRYASFQNMSQQIMRQQKSMTGDIDTKKVGELMKPTFGDTFYWFYFFCRDVKSY